VFSSPLHRTVSSSVVACVFIFTGICLLSHCLAMNILWLRYSSFQASCNNILELTDRIKCNDEFLFQGKADTLVTIYKKTDETYHLKLKASQKFYSEVTLRYSSMPFSLRSFEDTKKARMAVVECANHKLVKPYKVLNEKPGMLLMK
jgi:hypothetical protein